MREGSSDSKRLWIGGRVRTRHEQVTLELPESALLTRRGGHVGFITGTALRPAFWAEARLLRLLQEQ